VANYNSSNIQIQLDVSVGGALQDITASITKIGSTKVTDGVVESTPFGVAFPQWLATGLATYADIPIEGFYEDTATTGMHAVFSPRGVRTFKVTYGGGKYTQSEVLILDYERLPAVGTVTPFKATLRPTGTVTEA